MNVSAIKACIERCDSYGMGVRGAEEELEALEKSLSESLARDAERIELGKALGWLMEASEVNLGSGDDEFNEAWLNAESVMCYEPRGVFLPLEELESKKEQWEELPSSGMSSASFYGSTVDCVLSWLAAKIKQAKVE